MDHTRDRQRNVGSKEECVAMLEAFKSATRTSIYFQFGSTTRISISKTPSAPKSQAYFFAVSKEGTRRSVTGYCSSIDVAISRFDEYLEKSS